MQPIVLRNSAPAERVWSFYLYVSAVVLAGAAVATPFLWTVPGLVWHGSTAFWLMVLLALLADVRPYVPSGACRTSAIYPSVCFTFAIMLTSGLGAAVLVQWLAVVVHTWLHRDLSLRPLFTAGQYAVSFGVAYGVLAGFGALPFLPAGRYQVVVVVLAALVWFVTSHLLVSVMIWLWSGGALSGIVRRTAGYEVLSRIGLLLLAAVLAGAAVSSSSPWLVPLVLVPLYAVYRTARLAEQHERLAMLDPLTGLANRKALRVRIEQETAVEPRGSPGSGRFALLLLDLDRFKEVNDTLGHGVGDRLLVEVAQRLSRAVDPRHLVARLGGDEFAVLAPGMDQAMAMDLARRIGGLLSEPVQLDGMPLDVHSSIGVVSFPEHGDDYASLMRCADVAMYQAKSRGDTVATYQPETDHHSTHRLGLLGELRRVLDAPRARDAGIELYYQPQVAIASGEVVAVEALLRWNHPERGYVDPEELIRVAEHSAVMRLLTFHVLGEVTRQLAEWEAAGHTVRAAVNVSVRDLHAPEFADRLAELLVAHGVRSTQLQLEITEGALMADSRRVLATLRRLEDLGVTLSLDDFGTGYSSMLHLRRMPLAEVKIDRSFVLGMSRDEDDTSIVRSIIELATALGLRVVAEGVEDERTWRRLAALGCHVAQGWFFARPMPASELPSWLANYRPPRLLRSLAPETII
jgi:diguanylate cyclase (GGDEF)-like protein